MLDLLCLTGSVAWARLSSGPTQVVGATPIALFLREHTDAWLARITGRKPSTRRERSRVTMVRYHLRHSTGASFANEIASACELTDEELRNAIAELVAAGAISSDGFEGLRAIVGTTSTRATGRPNRTGASGRWFLVRDPGCGIRDPKNAEPAGSRIPHPGSRPASAIETFAWTLLRRYGVMFRRLLTREALDVPWRDLARVYRRLEARGEIRGGRFRDGYVRRTVRAARRRGAAA
jgi:ATP-dependent Lhr-like helicase